MSEAVVYEQLDQGDRAGPPAGSDADLRRLSDVPMEASVEIGRTSMTVGETLQLRPGAVVVLDRLAGEPVDLLLNGTLIARGEVVVVDDQFGLRISQIVEDDPEGGPASDLKAAPPTDPEGVQAAAADSAGAADANGPAGGDDSPHGAPDTRGGQEEPATAQNPAPEDGEGGEGAGQ